MNTKLSSVMETDIISYDYGSETNILWNCKHLGKWRL